jgi:heme exporter protein A
VTNFCLSVENLALTRGERQLLEGLRFAVSAGETLVIRGPNGSGKTTLLRAIAGFVRPAAGRIALEAAGERTVPECCHLVGHRDGLRAALTVRENLAFLPALLGEGIGFEEAAARLKLRRLVDLPVGALSAGQRRRAALARLLVSHRPIWLLDEPTSALDTDSHAIVAELMATHAAAGGLTLAATHLDLGVDARVLELGR